LTQWGEAVGLAFQMADDILDAEQDAGEDGPPSYVKLMGIEDTRDRARALLDEALAAVAGLPQPQMLQALARHAVEREV
jgi:geranylgeranyl pyrophosphate synthase